MNLKQRLNKLEKEQLSKNTGFALIICNEGETSDEAKHRWRAENPGIIPVHTFFVQFVSPNKVQLDNVCNS